MSNAAPSVLKKVINKVLGKKPAKRGPYPVIPTAPAQETGQVIFCGFTEGFFHGNGKVDPRAFFPGFCARLHEAGLATVFATTSGEMLEQLTPQSSLVYIYREITPENIALYKNVSAKIAALPDPHTGPIFNRPDLGDLIAHKDRTNHFLTRAGISMPRLVTSADEVAEVFVNDFSSTGAEVSRTFDPHRYNTEFIDTQVPYKGENYYTTVRMLCVGGTLVRCNVGVRKAGESASVHGVDAPLDAELLRYMQNVLVDNRQAELDDLARRLGDVLGPGFFGHDLVIHAQTGIPHVCEVGFKFDAHKYSMHLRSVAKGLKASHGELYDGSFAIRSAEAFLKERARFFAGRPA